MNIEIPKNVKYIIETLENCGYEAYTVGGCVRDSLLGKVPKDWDICTSALPEQTKNCFCGERIIETGLKHGTITLMLENEPFEITTYRADGKYSDNRRPEQVKFVNVLKRDLARRDFTINAMAYNPKTGIVDYYGGQQDLAEKKIKCVGNPDKRFKEDALRIMRALRFAVAFGFCIDENTAKAMSDNKKLLQNISSERIATEINKIIMEDNICELLFSHLHILFEIIPELEPSFGFDQHSPYHCFDVLTHTLKTVENSPNDLIVRLTMLFHDIGKPECYTCDEDGIGHFRGHWQVSADMAKEILFRLRYDNETIKTVTELVYYHNLVIDPNAKSIKQMLNKIGEKKFMQLMDVKKADIMAKAVEYRAEQIDIINETIILANEIIDQKQCYSLKNLAINGKDLIKIGVKEGAEIGKILNMLLDMVIDESVENDKIKLLKTVEKLNNLKEGE